MDPPRAFFIISPATHTQTVQLASAPEVTHGGGAGRPASTTRKR